MMKRTQAREITTLAYFYTSASPRAIESEQGIEASWPYVIPMEKAGIAEWTRYNCLLRNSLNTICASTRQVKNQINPLFIYSFICVCLPLAT